jgi:hypothetical protein
MYRGALKTVEAMKSECVLGKWVVAGVVQTLVDTRKQNPSIAYRPQHRQIVPSATQRKVLHTNTVISINNSLIFLVGGGF